MREDGLCAAAQIGLIAARRVLVKRAVLCGAGAADLVER